MNELPFATEPIICDNIRNLASQWIRTIQARVTLNRAAKPHPGGALISIILPAKNEAAALAGVLPRLRAAYPDADIVLVDDGSSDETRAVSHANGARVFSHPYSMGNGAAIKRGAREARGDLLVFMDVDGQHEPATIARLLSKLDEGFDMVVGARAWSGQAGAARGRERGGAQWMRSNDTFSASLTKPDGTH